MPELYKRISVPRGTHETPAHFVMHGGMTITLKLICFDACGVSTAPSGQGMPIMLLKHFSNTDEAAADACMPALLERHFPSGLVSYKRISPVARICPHIAAIIN